MKELLINSQSTIENALILMSKANIKCLIVAEREILKGTLSDGDIRKALLKKFNLK